MGAGDNTCSTGRGGTHGRPQDGTGILGLDQAIDGLRIGDNVVWHCTSLDDFAHVLQPFLTAARRDGRRLVYVRFADHAALVSGDDVGFAPSTPTRGSSRSRSASTSWSRARARGPALRVRLPRVPPGRVALDLMVMNFFKVTCPFLFRLDTIAYFPLLRDQTTAATVAGIRQTTRCCST